MGLVVSILPCLGLNSAIILHRPSLSAQLPLVPLHSFSLYFSIPTSLPETAGIQRAWLPLSLLKTECCPWLSHRESEQG